MKKAHLVLIAGLFSSLVYAQTERSIDSEIKKVIVYQQGALITREAKCSLTKGKTTLVFKGLSSKIDPQNLQVKTANNQVTLVSVSHSIDYLNLNKTNKEIVKLDAKKRELTDSIKILKNLKAVYAQEKEMILSNKSIGGTNGVNVTELQNAASFFRNRLTEIESNSYQIDRKSYQLKERLVDVSKQLLELNTQVDLPTSQVKLVLSSEKALETSIDLDYLIGEASWTPNYDVRIKDVDNPLVLIYKAKVNQNTGEDWKDVNLTLSTGNPSISNTKPILDAYYLTTNNYYSSYKPVYSVSNKQFTGKIEGVVTEASTGEPLIGSTVSVKGAKTSTITNMEGKFSLEVPSPASIIEFKYIGFKTLELPANSSFANVRLEESVEKLEEVVVVGYGTALKEDYSGSSEVYPKKKNIIPIAIQKQQTSTEFKIDIPYSIPSDKKDYDVSMIQYEIPATYSYSAVPKLSNDVYLVARLTDWTKYNMLNGNANLFFKGIYQGNSFLDLKSTDDTLSISVGRDKDIVIEREIQKDFTSKGFASSYRKELKGWNINIKNNKESSIKLVVEDQYPISKSDDIKVELMEQSGAQQDKDTGKLIWSLDLKPKEKKTLLLKYSVKYPKDKKVVVE